MRCKYTALRFISMLVALVVIGVNPLTLHAKEKQRKKVALVLSGGGAKGAAHIGAIKVIEEAGIPIDMVVGTSIGAIVGGLYSIGYTPVQLDSMVRRLDWDVLLSDRVKTPKQSLFEREHSERYVVTLPLHRKKPEVSGLIQGENLSMLFSELTVGYHGELDFDALPRPFACVATEMQTGREHVFRHGELSTAMRASMAFPGVFAPVLLNSMVLLDGGMRNNYPADVAKAMGADFIIGVSVQEELASGERLTKMSDLLFQVMGFLSRDKLEENVALTDVFIHVDTHPYSTMSFSQKAIDSLLVIGEHTARRQFPDLEALRQKIGLSADEHVQAPSPYSSYATGQGVLLHKITFSGTTPAEERRLLKKSRLKKGQRNTLSQIETAVSVMREELAFSDVTYRLYNDGEGYALNFDFHKKKEINLNLGARFDTEEIAAVMLNASLRFDTPIPSRLSLTGRVGKRYMGRVDYRLTPGLLKHLNFSYQYEYGDYDVYNKGNRILNATYNHHTAEANYSNVWWRNLRYDFGAAFDVYHNIDLLTAPGSSWHPSLSDSRFISYFFRLHYNSFDRSYFPKRGGRFYANYQLVTDNFYAYKGGTPFSTVQASWESVWRLGSRTVLLPAVHGRSVIGHNTSPLYNGVIGGVQAGLLFPHQLPFDGFTHLEVIDKTVVVGSMKLRQRIATNHFAMISSSVALTGEDAKRLFHHSPIWGFSAGYGLNTKLGPLQALVGYSPYTREMNFFVNAGFYF